MTESEGRGALSRGIAAARVGNASLARVYLREAAERSPGESLCWLWLAWVAESPGEAVGHLQKAVALNPDHEIAWAGLRWAQGMTSSRTVDLPAVVEVKPSVVAAPTPEVAPLARQASVDDPVADHDDDDEPSIDDPQVETQVPVARAAVATHEFAAQAVNEWPALDVDEAEEFEPVSPVPAGSRAESDWATEEPADLVDDDEVPEESAPQFLERLFSLPKNNEDGAIEPEPEVIPSTRSPEPSYPRNGSDDRKTTIMVVDDSPTVRKLVSITLTAGGYRVISAEDGVEAVTMIGKDRPDLILMDINMPRLDGYKLCKLLKSHEKTRRIPVIMLSGKDGFFDKARGKLVGCSNYITKPFEPDLLMQEVEKHLPATVAGSR